jgi:MFS family permease
MQARWRALWVLSAAREAVGATAPLLRDTYGLALADVGWLVGLYLLPGLVLALPGGLLSARLGDRRIAVAGTALMVAGGAICAFATTVTVLEAGRIVGGIGGVLFNVTATKMVADWFAGREIELAMSIFVGTWPLGIGLGLMTLGAGAALGGPAAAFALTAALAALSLLLVLLLYRPAPAAAAAGALRWSALAPGDLGRLGLAASAWTTYNVGFALLVAFLPTLLAERGLPPGRAR